MTIDYQPITLFSLLWVVVPLLALGEGMRRWRSKSTRQDFFLYTFLAGLDLWAYILANTIHGKAFATLGTVLTVILFLVKPSARRLETAVLFGLGVLLMVRSFGLIGFSTATIAIPAYLTLMCLWALWRMMTLVRSGKGVSAEGIASVAALLGALFLALGAEGFLAAAYTIGTLSVLASAAGFLRSEGDKSSKAVMLAVFISDVLIFLVFTNPHG